MAQAQMQQAQATEQKTQPMGGQEKPAEGKKMAWWIWLIIAIVVIAIGAGAYYFFFM